MQKVPESPADDDALDFVQTKKYLLNSLKNALKRAERGLKKLQSQVEETSHWEERHHEALLLQSHQYLIKKGMTSVKVHDWKESAREVVISLDSKLAIADEISNRFKKAKKLKRGIEPTKLAFDKLEGQVAKLKKDYELAALASNLEELSPWLTPKPVKQSRVTEKNLPYDEFETEQGLKIWVGKSAKKNDEVTFKWARGSDFWFHVHGAPGSHVILRVSKTETPDQESIQDALCLAIHHSKLKNEKSAEVLMTLCKFVSRMGKALGKVQVSKHKMVLAHSDPTRLRKIKERKSR